MQNEIAKLNQALYYENIIQAELNNITNQEEMTPEEYEAACDKIIHQKLYVEKAAVDVIKFAEYLKDRAELLKTKKQEMNEKQKYCEKFFEKAKEALKTWLDRRGLKSEDIEEYHLSLRKSKRLIVDEEKTDKIPDEFKIISVKMGINYYKALVLAGFNFTSSVISIDNESLKKWLLEGNICEGAHTEDRQNLQGI